MPKKKIQEIIRFLEENLRKQNLNISKIAIFGSQAKGSATGESDLDIVIVSKDFQGRDIFERVKLIKEPEILTIKKFMVPLDIITMTPEEFESESSLIAAYAREGEIVFAA
jgi:predicted nucleotidyltransferase